VAYIETNRLIATINERINRPTRANCGFRGTRLPATHNFDEEQLMSDWSHKHVAYIAGIGSFGHHHMLITDKGCCGRLGSVVTDAVIVPTSETGPGIAALFKYDGSAALNAKSAARSRPSGKDPFRRHACYDRLWKMPAWHERHGLADVCGKCAAIVPCSFVRPGEIGRR
jgi:hypothetical protein